MTFERRSVRQLFGIPKKYSKYFDNEIHEFRGNGEFFAMTQYKIVEAEQAPKNTNDNGIKAFTKCHCVAAISRLRKAIQNSLLTIDSIHGISIIGIACLRQIDTDYSSFVPMHNINNNLFVIPTENSGQSK